MPKTPDSKMMLLVRRTLPERERIHCSLYQEEILFFLFTHASSPFPLETSGSFSKFNSFLFIYLFIFLNLIFYLLIRSLQPLDVSLTAAITPVRSGHGSNGNKGVHYIP